MWNASCELPQLCRRPDILFIFLTFSWGYQSWSDLFVRVYNYACGTSIRISWKSTLVLIFTFRVPFNSHNLVITIVRYTSSFPQRSLKDFICPLHSVVAKGATPEMAGRKVTGGDSSVSVCRAAMTWTVCACFTCSVRWYSPHNVVIARKNKQRGCLIKLW